MGFAFSLALLKQCNIFSVKAFPITANNLYKEIESLDDAFSASDACTGCGYARSCARYQIFAAAQIRRSREKDNWAGISGIGMIRSKRQQVGSDDVESSVKYFIYSKDMTAMELLAANRAHWKIENSLHWVLDMDFREDESRMRLGNCATNMNVFRHLALHLIKSESSTTLSVNMKRKRCMLSLDYLLKVIGVS